MAETAPKVNLTTQQRAEYEQLVRDKAAQMGVDPDRAARFVRLESNFDPAARNPRGGAAGLFQFVPETARSMGLDERTVFDAQANADAGLRFMANVDKDLSKRLGRSVSDYEHYIGHFLGPRGAQNALSMAEKNPNMPMPQLLRSYLTKKRADKQLRDNPEFAKETVGQFIARQQSKVSKASDDLPSVQLARATPAAAPVAATAATTPARMNPNLQAQGEKAAATRAAATPKPAAATTPAPATTPEQLLSSASQYGPDYQAALALAALGDDDDDEEYTTKSGEPLVRARTMLEEMTPAEPAKTVVADLSLKVASPFAALQPKGGGPVQLAMGGMVEPITPMGMQVQSPFANSANPTVAGMAGNVPRGTMPGQSTVFRAEGSPESGETPARSTLESFKEQTKAFGRGVADLPYTIVGAPVDIATFIGRNVPGVSKLLPGINQEQVGSTEYLKRQMENAGLREPAPTQPNLKAAYEAGSMLSSFASPTGVVLGARRMIGKAGEAAKALREMPAQEAAVTRAAPVPEPRPTAQPPVQQELPLPVPEPTPVPAPVAVAAPTESRQMLQAMPEVTPPVTPAAPAVPKWDELALHEKAERPFVSKLEMHVDKMQGKTTPEQFLNSLKGKFRDHEITRAQEALADVAPGTKLTSQDIGSRLADLYSPRGWKTEIKEPKVGQFYAPHDNPFPGEAIGAINLLERAPAYVTEAKKMLETLPNSYLFMRTDKLPEKALQNLENFFSTPYAEAVPQGKKILEDLRGLVQQYRQTPSAGLREAMEDIQYPILSSKYEQIKAKNKFNTENMHLALTQVTQDALQVVNKALGTKIKLQPGTSTAERRFIGPNGETDLNELQDKVRKIINEDTTVAALEKKTRQTLAPLEAIRDKYKLYKGQHSPIASDNPIGFSRFVEIPAVIPGQGQMQAMHVLELQADRLDDLRTLGKRGSSVEKDRELADKHDAVIEQLLTPFPKGSNQRDYLDTTRTSMMMELTEKPRPDMSGLTGMDRALGLLGNLPDELQGVGQKMLNEIKAQVPAKRRLLASEYMIEKAPPTYNIHEAFAGMEHKPQEVQQLLMKNAINGAIERGLNMVSFPSVESKQAQLYRNVANNMKQVIKDLGGEKSGFELLMVEHKDGLTGKTYQSPAIRWGDETADKLRQTGIPFKKGGLVERKMDDNRTYL
jgi:hypothetical protein